MPERKSSDSQSGDKVICEIDLSSDLGFKELKTLTKDSKFVCRGCGRAAAREERLCQPEWIY
jgi:hypothetical protein